MGARKGSETSSKNSYFLHWNFDWKSCFVVFFHEWNEWKNPQFNFSSQDLSIEGNFFKWDGKVTKIWHLLFHRIWKKICEIAFFTIFDRLLEMSPNFFSIRFHTPIKVKYSQFLSSPFCNVYIFYYFSLLEYSKVQV